MENKKPFYKKWWFWLIVAVLVIGILGNNDDTVEVVEEEPANETEVEEIEPIEDEVDEPEETEEPTEEEDTRTIDVFLQEENSDVDTVTLEDGVLIIKGEGKTTFSENTLFYSVYDMFEVMHEAFQDESVDEVHVELNTTMVDQKGNESVEPVIKYNYTREYFEDLNYDNFSSMAFGQQWRILNQANYYYIHPGIYTNLDDKYTDHLNVEGFN